MSSSSSSSSSVRHEVSLAVYDLSNGLASQFSLSLLGQHVPGIWHTGVRVYGTEYFYGGGIQHCASGMTPYGRPVRVDKLGHTTKSRTQLDEFLQSRQITMKFSPHAYDLLDNNCNHFSDACVRFLVDNSHGIDKEILNLPDVVKNSPMFGPMLRPAVDMVQRGVLAMENGSATESASPSAIGENSSSNNNNNSNDHYQLGSYRKDLQNTCIVLRSGDANVIKSRLRSMLKSSVPDDLDDVETLISLASSSENPLVAFPALDLLRLQCISTSSASTPLFISKLSNALPSLISLHVSSTSDERATFTCLRLLVNFISLSPTPTSIALIPDETIEFAIVNQSSTWRVFKTGVLLLRNIASFLSNDNDDRVTRYLYLSNEGINRIDEFKEQQGYEIVMLPSLQTIVALIDIGNETGGELGQWDVLDAYGFGLEEIENDARFEHDKDVQNTIQILKRLRSKV